MYVPLGKHIGNNLALCVHLMSVFKMVNITIAKSNVVDILTVGFDIHNLILGSVRSHISLQVKLVKFHIYYNKEHFSTFNISVTIGEQLVILTFIYFYGFALHAIANHSLLLQYIFIKFLFSFVFELLSAPRGYRLE